MALPLLSHLLRSRSLQPLRVCRGSLGSLMNLCTGINVWESCCLKLFVLKLIQTNCSPLNCLPLYLSLLLSLTTSCVPLRKCECSIHTEDQTLFSSSSGMYSSQYLHDPRMPLGRGSAYKEFSHRALVSLLRVHSLAYDSSVDQWEWGDGNQDCRPHEYKMQDENP